MTSLLLLKSMLYANALQKKKKSKKKVNISKPKKRLLLNPNLCRICNEDKGEIPIFENYGQPNIAEEIKHFSGVTISKFDSLSKYMCQGCLDLLNGCIMFRDMCQLNNKKLTEIAVKKEYYENEDKEQRYNEGEYHSAVAHHNVDERLNLEENRNIDDCLNVEAHRNDSDDESYNIPSPTFSEDPELWECTTCGKVYFDLESYNKHLPRCNSNNKTSKAPKQPGEGSKKKFLCDVCGKIAGSNAGLLVHMGIHGNVFPFKCDQCPYQGRTMDLLKVHQRTHLADKPFKCTQCPKTTTTSSNLAKHMRHVHSTTRPFKCSYCDKAFSYQHDMKTHIKDIHLRQGTVECDVCYKKFNTRKILRGHRWKIHKIKGERQGRLPSYLQCQMEEDKVDNSNSCQPDICSY